MVPPEPSKPDQVPETTREKELLLPQKTRPKKLSGQGGKPAAKDHAARGKPAAGQDPRKRRQITDAAHRLFLAQGFDVTSMEEIAREAGVSKATLYVYFKDKEELFAGVTAEAGFRITGPMFALVDPNNHDVRAVLRRIGTDLTTLVTRPQMVKALRAIITMGERIPDLGANYYQQGPMMGLGMLSQYLKAQVEHGILAIDDPFLAAAQFVEMAQATLARPLLFGTGETPGAEQIAHVVEHAVDVFMAAYERPSRL